MFSLEGEKKAKKNVTMLTTIHEAVMVETGKTDFFGNKFEKPEAVYYYCVSRYHAYTPITIKAEAIHKADSRLN